MDQNDPPQFNHPISASYGSSSGDNLAEVLSGGHAPQTKHLSSQTGDFYFGTFGENSSGTHTLRAKRDLEPHILGPTLFLRPRIPRPGCLEAVERAMGLMAGHGLQLWPILQDMSQLKDLYGDRAGTFIANARVQQIFWGNNFETAKWLSQMIGQEIAGFQTDSFTPGDALRQNTSARKLGIFTSAPLGNIHPVLTGPSFSNNVTGRDLLTPDEIM